MAPDTPEARSMSGPRRQDASLHQAAWPDMLTNLHVAYAELTHTQLELERRMAEIDETRELFARVIESMSEGLFLTDIAGRIISMQQDLTRAGGLQESVRLTELMEEALTINLAALERHHIEVVREYAEIPQIVADKHLVLQILVNLISNAKYAMLDLEGQARHLTLRLGMAEDREGFVRLQVQDTGVAIKPEHLSRIFAQRFTTRKDGHGLGLHSGALAARALGGLLHAHSDGEGLSATFTLDLPLKPAEDRP